MHDPSELPPTDMLPSAHGLAWGPARGQCLRRVRAPVAERSAEALAVRLLWRHALYRLCLRFAGPHRAAGLVRLELPLYISWAWADDDTPPDCDCYSTRFDSKHNQTTEPRSGARSRRSTGRIISGWWPRMGRARTT